MSAAVVRMAPILAYKAPPKKPLRLEELAYPLAVSFKYDGFRLLRLGRLAVTRNIKPLPNIAIREWLEGLHALRNCDGELIVGSPTAPDCFKRTSSLVTTVHGGMSRDVRFVVFDWFGETLADLRTPYFDRWRRAADAMKQQMEPRVTCVGYRTARDAKDAALMEADAIARGYEGIMLRSPEGIYKMNRCTLKEQYLIAVKRFEDFEAEILDVLPRTRNDNEQTRDLLGRAKRSKVQANMVPLPVVGKFVVRELKGKRRTMECGTGQFTLDECARLWPIRRKLRGLVLNCRRQPDATGKRFPRAAGFRSRIDF